MTQQNANAGISFHIYYPNGRHEIRSFFQDVIKIGSLSSNHLAVDDEKVSRMHAVVEASSADEVTVIDVGSGGGTFVNGAKINKCHLQSGDEIQVGETRLVIKIQSGAPSEVNPMADDDSTEVGSARSIDEEETSSQGSPPPLAQARRRGALEGSKTPSSPPTASAPQPPPPVGPRLKAPAKPPRLATGVMAATPLGVGFSAAAGAPGFADASQTSEDNRYGIVASGPAINPEEVETQNPAVEIVIMWGEDSVLHVAHLSPPRSFYVGETPLGKDAKKDAPVDFLVASEVIGAERLPLVVQSGEGVAVIVPQGSEAELAVGSERLTYSDLQARGLLVPSSELPGAHQFALPRAGNAKIQYKGFIFLIKGVMAAKPVGVGTGPLFNWSSHKWTAVSAGVHIAFLLMFYFLPPRPSSLSLDLLNTDSRLVKYLMEPPELEEEEPEWLQGQGEQQGGKGERHKDEEGQMGKKEASKSKNKFGIKGPQDNQDPHMAREQAKEEARTAGVLGVLKQAMGSFDSPTSPYGRDTALGNDPMSALGALMGDQIGENFGYGGLGLRGTGRGGGGTGEGTIGLGNLGTIGHGAGGGDGSGYGRGAGGFRGREARVPTIRPGAVESVGSLSKEVIRRVVRRHLNEVRFCYEQELNQRPDLDGRVVVKFIISPAGAVQSSAVAESSLGNAKVESCIAQSVRRWTFPSPEGGGIVVVNYPFALTASGG